MPAFCVLHNFEFNLDLRQMPGCGNSSSKGDILPSGDENVFWLERFCSYHCLPGIRKCLIRWESFRVHPTIPARPRNFRPREKYVESWRPNLISAFSHSLISMPSLSFLEYKSRSNLDEYNSVKTKYGLRLYIPITESNSVMVVSSWSYKSSQWAWNDVCAPHLESSCEISSSPKIFVKSRIWIPKVDAWPLLSMFIPLVAVELTDFAPRVEWTWQQRSRE